MVTALANGAAALIPVTEIPEALALHQQRPELLLAGEREGVRIPATLTGGASFDFGNSPREFTSKAIAGKTIVMTTTNGTRALRACAHARLVLLGAFLNLRATADFIVKNGPRDLLLVCSGTHDEAAYEDVLCAGALCDLLWTKFSSGKVADSALMARKLYDLEKHDLKAAFAHSRNGARLSSIPDLRDDLPFCAQCDILRLVAQLTKAGEVKRLNA
jgi:2-phosphosulfolactate phosphatase